MATPSVAMIPSGYKDGTLYNVLPNNAAGDFDVTRGSLATRVNESGLIEPVGTLGADVVLNGDFEETGADQVLNGDFSQEGSEVVTNGDFATDSDWTKGSGWTISGGKANCDGTQSGGTSVYQSVFQQNKSYKITFSITNISSGEVGVVNSPKQTSIGTYTYYYYTTSADTNLYINADASFVGSIDNVSVVEVGQDWLTSGGSEVTEQGVRINNTITGVNAFIKQSNSNFTTGKSFVLEYDVVSTNGTTLAIEQTSSIALNTSTIGNNRKLYFQWDIASTGLLIKRLTTGTDVTITNISVKEVGQEWTLTDGCSITAQGARITSDGTYQDITQSGALVIGDTYEMEYEITESVSGLLSVTSSFGSGIVLKNTLGVHKFYAVAAISGLQIKRSSSPTDITIDNIKVKRLNGDDTPRIDYTDGGCPVLLTEPQSTNLITNSNDMLASNWNQTTATVTLSSTINPFGNSQCYRVERVGSGLQLGGVTAATIGEEYTYSIYLRKISGSGVVNMKDVNNSVQQVTVTDEWQRYTASAEANSASGRYYLTLGSDGDVIEASFAQLEELSYATSLIPTYGEVRTRLQDSVNGAGTSSDFNSVEGVLFAEVSALANDETFKRISIGESNNGFVNSIQLRFDEVDDSLTYQFRVGGSYQASIQVNINSTDINKIACVWKTNRFEIWVNGVKEGEDTSGSVPSANTFDSLFFGKRSANLDDPFFGKISQVQVFKTALSDFELTQLTTI